jgi:hypothetical protein
MLVSVNRHSRVNGLDEKTRPLEPPSQPFRKKTNPLRPRWPGSLPGVTNDGYHPSKSAPFGQPVVGAAATGPVLPAIATGDDQSCVSRLVAVEKYQPAS